MRRWLWWSVLLCTWTGLPSKRGIKRASMIVWSRVLALHGLIPSLAQHKVLGTLPEVILVHSQVWPPNKNKPHIKRKEVLKGHWKNMCSLMAGILETLGAVRYLHCIFMTFNPLLIMSHLFCWALCHIHDLFDLETLALSPFFKGENKFRDGEVLAHGCVEPIINAQKQALSSWTPYHSFQQLLFLWLLLTKFCSNLTALPGNTLFFCTSGLFLSQLESCDSLLGNQFPFMFPPSPPVHLLPWAGTTNYRLSWCRDPIL